LIINLTLVRADGFQISVLRQAFSVGGNNMTTKPKHNISSDKATDLLNAGQPLSNFYISGELVIEITGTWDKEIVIENCVVEYFSGSVTEFEKSVRLINSQFKKCQFLYTYFIGGLTIENCIFDSYLDFQAGGHNKPENKISISNNNFADFVNFFDCWYTGQISLTNNNFYKGTNVESKKQLITFDFQPTIENNTGKINVESELAETGE